MAETKSFWLGEKLYGDFRSYSNDLNRYMEV